MSCYSVLLNTYLKHGKVYHSERRIHAKSFRFIENFHDVEMICNNVYSIFYQALNNVILRTRTYAFHLYSV